ncbi:MAG TPA: MlaD family protein [Rhizomicrobium sp.]|jgi:phospholipid/cholesterol/gamma-HCH transport system substrate-binding protein|nr:MlaD family protein [Rhizomicrobium sp.]
MKQNNVFEVLLSAAVVVVAVSFLAYTYTITGAARPSDYELKAEMAHADGLSSASDVRIGGIKVGSVSDLALDPKTYKALVRLRIRSDVQVPVNSTIGVASGGLSPGSYLAITPGTSNRTLTPGSAISAR